MCNDVYMCYLYYFWVDLFGIKIYDFIFIKIVDVFNSNLINII